MVVIFHVNAVTLGSIFWEGWELPTSFLEVERAVLNLKETQNKSQCLWLLTALTPTQTSPSQGWDFHFLSPSL